MNSLVRRHPAVRWAAPALVVGLIGAGQLVSRSADAAPSLPAKTPQQLLASALSAKVPGLSGTVTTSADLGLPQLPEGTGSGVAGIPLSLLSGSHTMKVWYAGGTGARVALLGRQSETDLIANRTDAWVWNSSDRTVLHAKLPSGGKHANAPVEAPKYSPQQIADWALKQAGPTTAVSSSANTVVAGRSAYDLTLTPKQSGTKVGSIHVAIDAKTSIPLQVKVFAKGAANPALSVGFSQVSFTVPDKKVFEFTPPAGASVKSVAPQRHSTDKTSAAKGRLAMPSISGTGWETVLTTTLPSKASQSVQDALTMLPAVSGSWGKGRLLDTALVSAVVTDDGRVAAGMVPPSALYTALGRG
ncbi:hypothetical protein G9U51_15340 [Calidifontibacter sp. DB0510]|uniref:DUF2092 domain-containing protein n=1 Tax=Metallococcus carri TaxID=1656884 RepID=A0A967B377_9MICO|nr:hypothetical protein [Metallococcus carri]NHN57144.1 hypothetical protein [Metallococcus carri]NOP38053.1 hypothetical protein [Calidifontibacter sp. DB2511S]